MENDEFMRGLISKQLNEVDRLSTYLSASYALLSQSLLKPNERERNDLDDCRFIIDRIQSLISSLLQKCTDQHLLDCEQNFEIVYKEIQETIEALEFVFGIADDFDGHFRFPRKKEISILRKNEVSVLR